MDDVKTALRRRQTTTEQDIVALAAQKMAEARVDLAEGRWDEEEQAIAAYHAELREKLQTIHDEAVKSLKITREAAVAKLQAAETANLAQGTIDLAAEGSEILADFQKKVQELAEKPEPVVKYIRFNVKPGAPAAPTPADTPAAAPDDAPAAAAADSLSPAATDHLRTLLASSPLRLRLRRRRHNHRSSSNNHLRRRIEEELYPRLYDELYNKLYRELSRHPAARRGR
ncbi:hypothetical protein F5Y04DRAFT_278684 [Hypomontagnella monticulosa]|nr:hypothetical protein F5Y04DRAFT_278684 [Hypomontagnella monticulosa]